MAKNIFEFVQFNRVKGNTFDLSHDRKFSFNMGDLIPMLVLEVLPGDKFTVRSNHVIRFSPLVAPVMHKIDVYTHYFFVPNRLIWQGWEKFITGQENLTIPYVDSTAEYNGSISDYLGIPCQKRSDPPKQIKFNALVHAAYGLIYDNYYRDQNLQDPLFDEDAPPFSAGDTDVSEKIASLGTNGEVSLINGGDSGQYGMPLKRAWRKDMFTSALPEPQAYQEVLLPMLGTADVMLKNETEIQPDIVRDSSTFEPVISGNLTADNGALKAGTSYASVDNSHNLEVDLTSATAASINDLRRAVRLQEWLERTARGGKRYIEMIFSHFSTRSSDSRLQNPEYLGGGKSPVLISEITQMSSSDAVTPQGNMSGHGVNVGESHSFTRHFEEHGYIIGIMSMLPEPSYMQGLDRHYSRKTYLDYAWPSFGNLGEQEILNKELYYDTSDNKNDEVFGYTPRYAEYKYKHSSVHGEFRDTLDYWHMARKFANRPLLNEDFVKSNPTFDIFAVQPTEDDKTDTLYAHVYHSIKANRKLPFYGNPTL